MDLVIDSLGASVLPRSFDALRTYGRVINIGEAAGEPEFNVRKKLYERSTSLAGFEVLHAEPGSERWAAGVGSCSTRWARGASGSPLGWSGRWTGSRSCTRRSRAARRRGSW